MMTRRDLLRTSGAAALACGLSGFPLGWRALAADGMFFVGMQVYEFTHFVHKGLTLSRNMFGASFFVLTGFHGTHVTIGVIWLLTMFVLALRGKLTPNRSLNQAPGTPQQE